MSKRHKQTLHKRESKRGKYPYENVLTSLVTKEISVKTTVKYNFTYIKLAKIKEFDNTNFVEGVERWELECSAGGTRN